MMEPGRHHLLSFTHLISKHAPHASPLLNKAVLSAAVFVPYPWLYKFPYPHAPPSHEKNMFIYLFIFFTKGTPYILNAPLVNIIGVHLAHPTR
ncbi:hypothetical protein Hanom_Chr14g01275731 [Helianthus anomalus]